MARALVNVVGGAELCCFCSSKAVLAHSWASPELCLVRELFGVLAKGCRRAPVASRLDVAEIGAAQRPLCWTSKGSLSRAEPHGLVSNFARSMGKPRRGHIRILSINGGQSQRPLSLQKPGKLNHRALHQKVSIRTLQTRLCIHSLTCGAASRRKQRLHPPHKHKAAWPSCAPPPGWRTRGWRTRHAAEASQQ